MKLYSTLLLAVIFTVGTANAQDAHLGFKAGLNLFDVNASNSKNFSKIGFHAGLQAHLHLTKRFALQPEVMYSGQGAKFERFNGKLNLDYVNVPILFQYMFNNGFRLQAGPQVGFLVNAKYADDNGSTNSTDDFNMLDLGLSIGTSYVHTASGFGIDLRYNHGLSQINKNGPEKLSNRGFQLGLFYLMGHKQ